MVTCANCKIPLDKIDLAVEPRVPCPNCGATARSDTMQLSAGIRNFASLGERLKRLSLPSDKKIRWESFTGYEICRDRQKMVHKVRMYDKDSDEYVERVVDIETGEIIHECVEPFSKHVGHGTAKKKKP
jgi:hypothetical protein